MQARRAGFGTFVRMSQKGTNFREKHSALPRCILDGLATCYYGAMPLDEVSLRRGFQLPTSI